MAAMAEVAGCVVTPAQAVPLPTGKLHRTLKHKTLRPEEIERLRENLERLNEITKISPGEVEQKKDIVKWLLELLTKHIKPKNMINKKLYRAGSAFEKVQAGEANDFDVMVYFNIWNGVWKVEEDASRPGFCSIKLVGIRDTPKKSEAKTIAKRRRTNYPLIQLLDDKQCLSSFKVRKLFSSMIDKLLKRKCPLMYKYKMKADSSSKESSEQVEKSVLLMTTRVQRGPATTLIIECPELKLAPFTLDLVACLQDTQVNHKSSGNEKYDYVAKPVDKREAFSTKFGHLWRESYSKQERKIFANIDKENQIHRRVLRVFKILRIYQSQLKCLKSYVYKNVLLHLSEVPGKKWQMEDLPHRFVDMVIALRDCLASGSLPVFFNRKINLLADYEESQLTRIAGYLKRIANKGLEGYLELLSLKEKDHMLSHTPVLPRKRRRRPKPKQPSVKEPNMSIEQLLEILKRTKSQEAKKNLKKRKKDIKAVKAGRTKLAALFAKVESSEGEESDLVESFNESEVEDDYFQDEDEAEDEAGMNSDEESFLDDHISNENVGSELHEDINDNFDSLQGLGLSPEEDYDDDNDDSDVNNFNFDDDDCNFDSLQGQSPEEDYDEDNDDSDVNHFNFDDDDCNFDSLQGLGQSPEEDYDEDNDDSDVNHFNFDDDDCNFDSLQGLDQSPEEDYEW